MRIHARSRRSFNLISVTFASVVFLGASVGTISALVTAMRLNSLNDERNIANQNVEIQFENIQVMDRNLFLKNFPEPSNGAPAQAFIVPELLPQTDPGTGLEIPSILVYVIPPKGVPYPNAEAFNVHVQVRWRNRNGLGDFQQEYSLVILPPDRFD